MIQLFITMLSKDHHSWLLSLTELKFERNFKQINKHFYSYFIFFGG